MAFRRKGNSHDGWLDLVREQASLLTDLPREAIASEAAFRDYVTCGVHRGKSLVPSVSEISTAALDALWSFIQMAHFDMDAERFEDFNETYRLRHQATP